MRGRLGEHFKGAFDGMDMEPGRGQTLLTGEVRDQAHLRGLPDRLRGVGIDLVSVELFRPGKKTTPTRAAPVVGARYRSG